MIRGLKQLIQGDTSNKTQYSWFDIRLNRITCIAAELTRIDNHGISCIYIHIFKIILVRQTARQAQLKKW